MPKLKLIRVLTSLVCLVPLTVQASCPPKLEPLVEQLLTALPSYTNRMAQRRLGSQPLNTYLLTAGSAIFEPLPLAQGQWQSTLPDTSRQVFFTTLERHYEPNSLHSRQNFYRAFFVETNQGWQLALLYGQLGADLGNPVPQPPQDLSQGDVAQAIRFWLRDCKASPSPKSTP